MDEIRKQIKGLLSIIKCHEHSAGKGFWGCDVLGCDLKNEHGRAYSIYMEQHVKRLCSGKEIG
jgi:hypothetical protein